MLLERAAYKVRHRSDGPAADVFAFSPALPSSKVVKDNTALLNEEQGE